MTQSCMLELCRRVVVRFEASEPEGCLINTLVSVLQPGPGNDNDEESASLVVRAVLLWPRHHADAARTIAPSA